MPPLHNSLYFYVYSLGLLELGPFSLGQSSFGVQVLYPFLLTSEASHDYLWDMQHLFPGFSLGSGYAFWFDLTPLSLE